MSLDGDNLQLLMAGKYNALLEAFQRQEEPPVPLVVLSLYKLGHTSTKQLAHRLLDNTFKYGYFEKMLSLLPEVLPDRVNRIDFVAILMKSYPHIQHEANGTVVEMGIPHQLNSFLRDLAQVRSRSEYDAMMGFAANSREPFLMQIYQVRQYLNGLYLKEPQVRYEAIERHYVAKSVLSCDEVKALKKMASRFKFNPITISDSAFKKYIDKYLGFKFIMMVAKISTHLEKLDYDRNSAASKMR